MAYIIKFTKFTRGCLILNKNDEQSFTIVARYQVYNHTREQGRYIKIQ